MWRVKWLQTTPHEITNTIVLLLCAVLPEEDLGEIEIGTGRPSYGDTGSSSVRGKHACISGGLMYACLIGFVF